MNRKPILELKKRIRVGKDEVWIRVIGNELWISFPDGRDVSITRTSKFAHDLRVQGWIDEDPEDVMFVCRDDEPQFDGETMNPYPKPLRS